MQMHPAVKKFSGWLYAWRDTAENQPGPGAEAAAFVRQMLPLYEWDGPGEPVLYQIQAFSRPMVVPQMVIPTGISGIQAGQIGPDGLMEMP